ncbi:DUF732 domain-containing protein [Streptosporangium saharense]|uniref:DUF732 domain-containing protein n=1 Tax=Streptosporangium saharense TaxID=1706840 RepID=UPI00331723F2
MQRSQQPPVGPSPRKSDKGMAIVAVVLGVAVVGMLALLVGLPDDGAETPTTPTVKAEPTGSVSTPVPVEVIPTTTGASAEPTPDPSASALEAVFTAAVKQREALRDADSYKLGWLGRSMCEALEEGRSFSEAAALGTGGFDQETSVYIARLAVANLCPGQGKKVPG